MAQFSDTEVTTGVLDAITESLALDEGKVNEKSRLFAELGADSLDVFDIMFSLEKRFGVTLNKEEFDLIKKIGLKPEEALQDGKLTAAAKERLKPWLPSIPVEQPLALSQVKDYISAETLVRIVHSLIASKAGRSNVAQA